MDSREQVAEDIVMELGEQVIGTIQAWLHTYGLDLADQQTQDAVREMLATVQDTMPNAQEVRDIQNRAVMEKEPEATA